MIPVSVPSLGDLERRYLLEAFDSTWISSRGPFVERFEEAFAQRCGVSHALAAANGTVALHLALAALGAGPGDEVVVPALTYVATGNAVRYCGATPVVVDVDPATWCIAPERVEAAVTERTVGILSVDLYGHPADYDALRRIADQRGLWWVSDSAEAVLARYRGRVVGADADITTFSFFGNKVLTSGEGGAVTTGDDGLARRMAVLRNQGNHPTQRYQHVALGYNYRLTNLQAALLCAQLERADELVARRTEVVQRYERGFADHPSIGLQPVADDVVRSPWMTSVTVEPPVIHHRDCLIDQLAAVGVETRPFFVPLHRMAHVDATPCGALDVSEHLSAVGLNLPTHALLTDVGVDAVVAALRTALDASPHPDDRRCQVR